MGKLVLVSRERLTHAFATFRLLLDMSVNGGLNGDCLHWIRGGRYAVKDVKLIALRGRIDEGFQLSERRRDGDI